MKRSLELLRLVKPDIIKGILPDIRGMLEEREYRKLSKLGAKHKIPVPECHLTREAFWPDGSPLWKPRRRRSHSVVRNYYNMLFAYANVYAMEDSTFGTGLLSMKDIGGTVREGLAGGNTYMFRAAGASALVNARDSSSGILATAGVITHGIVIGTSSQAESFEDVALIAIVVNGSDGGQMDYTQSELHAITNSTLTLKNTLIRDVDNNSGGGITIEEVGIYIMSDFATADDTERSYLLTRDLTGGDVVADPARYRVTYENTLVYPS